MIVYGNAPNFAEVMLALTRFESRFRKILTDGLSLERLLYRFRAPVTIWRVGVRHWQLAIIIADTWRKRFTYNTTLRELRKLHFHVVFQCFVGLISNNFVFLSEMFYMLWSKMCMMMHGFWPEIENLLPTLPEWRPELDLFEWMFSFWIFRHRSNGRFFWSLEMKEKGKDYTNAKQWEESNDVDSTL